MVKANCSVYLKGDRIIILSKNRDSNRLWYANGAYEELDVNEIRTGPTCLGLLLSQSLSRSALNGVPVDVDELELPEPVKVAGSWRNFFKKARMVSVLQRDQAYSIVIYRPPKGDTFLVERETDWSAETAESLGLRVMSALGVC